LQMESAHGRMVVVVFETHPKAWNALERTFRESAARMVYLSTP